MMAPYILFGQTEEKEERNLSSTFGNPKRENYFERKIILKR